MQKYQKAAPLPQQAAFHSTQPQLYKKKASALPGNTTAPDLQAADSPVYYDGSS